MEFLRMKVKPLYDRVIVRPLAEEEKTKGGIIIPDTAKEKPMKGTVTAIGNGTTTDTGARIPLEIKVGDMVLYGKWAGTEIKIDGEDLLIMKESDVMAIVQN
jgi:chaperonin GroES